MLAFLIAESVSTRQAILLVFEFHSASVLVTHGSHQNVVDVIVGHVLMDYLAIVEHVSLVASALHDSTHHVHVDDVGGVAVDLVAAVGTSHKEVGHGRVMGRLLDIDFGTVASDSLVSFAKDWI